MGQHNSRICCINPDVVQLIFDENDLRFLWLFSSWPAQRGCTPELRVYQNLIMKLGTTIRMIENTDSYQNVQHVVKYFTST